MKRRNDEGMALLLALLFVALLSAIIVEFSYEMQVEAALVGNNMDQMEAYNAAKSAVAAGMGLLIADALAAADEKRDYVGLLDLWVDGIPMQPMNEAVMGCTITDECGKLNLNALAGDPEGESQQGARTLLEAALGALFEARGVEADPTDAILDWLDPDDEPRPNGAESDYYAALDVPYACKNGPMDSIEELLLIKDVTPELFFGDAEQDPPQLPLNGLLTVHGDPGGTVNANTAPREVLFAACEARYPGESNRAETALEQREEQPFEKAEQLNDLLRQPPPKEEGASAPPEIFDVTSSRFRVQGDGMTESTSVRIEAFAERPLERTGQIVRIEDWRVIR